MIKIFKTENSIKVEFESPKNDVVYLNDSQLEGDEVTFKEIVQASTEITRVKTNNFRLNIIGDNVFGRTINGQKFKGKLGETLEFFMPVVHKHIQEGTIRMCGHDH